MPRHRPVSMRDVALAAAVSPQTVSRVANGGESVTPSTRRRVEAAMRKLGYRPNYAARALKHGRFRNIGVALFDMTKFGNARILGGITRTAAERGYAVTLHIIGDDAPHTLRAVVDRMKRLPVDGVIVIMEQRLGDLDTFVPTTNLPVVLVGDGRADQCPTIDADQYGCSTAIVDYLMARGHATVHHIAGPSSSLAAQRREQGWRDALSRHGAGAPPVHAGDWGADSGYTAGIALAGDTRCTAIYAANDQMAYGAIAGLRDAGRSVPDDVSVVGVDDSLPGVVPGLELTTMRIRFEDIGAGAFVMLQRQCEGSQTLRDARTVVPSELIERGSVGAVTTH